MPQNEKNKQPGKPENSRELTEQSTETFKKVNVDELQDEIAV